MPLAEFEQVPIVTPLVLQVCVPVQVEHRPPSMPQLSSCVPKWQLFMGSQQPRHVCSKHGFDASMFASIAASPPPEASLCVPFPSAASDASAASDTLTLPSILPPLSFTPESAATAPPSPPLDELFACPASVYAFQSSQSEQPKSAVQTPHTATHQPRRCSGRGSTLYSIARPKNVLETRKVLR